MSTKLFLIRHAQTKWNAQGRIQGSLEHPLDEVGVTQAQTLGASLAEHSISAVYSSPMVRARQTAEILAQFHNCEVQLDPALREISYGAAEGLTREEYYLRYKEELAQRDQLNQEERFRFKVVLDGESPADAISRALPSLMNFAARHLDEHILVVSHGFVIRSLLAFLGGYDERKLVVSNVGLVHIEGNQSNLNIVGHRGIHIE